MCDHCQHIYGLYGICPWCEPGQINGYGSCSNCEFNLYKKPKPDNSLMYESVYTEDKNLYENENLTDKEEQEVCVLCSHIQSSQLVSSEYCEMCGYLLSNLCNECATTLRFEGDDEEIEETCWQCGTNLCENN